MIQQHQRRHHRNRHEQEPDESLAEGQAHVAGQVVFFKDHFGEVVVVF